jgi:hypothetical protein
MVGWSESNELIRIWKEAALAYLYLTGGSQKYHEISQSTYPVAWPRLEQSTSRIQIYSVTTNAYLLGYSSYNTTLYILSYLYSQQESV